MYYIYTYMCIHIYSYIYIHIATTEKEIKRSHPLILSPCARTGPDGSQEPRI